MANLPKPSPEIVELLHHKADEFNHPRFIESDPIQIPHRFSRKQDQEIAGLLSATIAWGNRKMIINNALKMMELMDNAPFDFIMQSSGKDHERLQSFVHRTFNGGDLLVYLQGLRRVYQSFDTLEALFLPRSTEENLGPAIDRFRKTILETPHEPRFAKHIASPQKGSASKRLIMFLRWMVRQDNRGVDLGIWTNISPALLSCPLDVHSGNVARKLKLLGRKQNDWKAVVELDQSLRSIDPKDPARFDFALFGLGVFEGF